ncbi:MAG: redoxin domain-containing protein [Armatimonadota bacterium]
MRTVKTLAQLMMLMLAIEQLPAQSASRIFDQTTRTYAQLRSLRLEGRLESVVEVQTERGKTRFSLHAKQLVMAMRPNLWRMEAVTQEQLTGPGFAKIHCDGKTLYIENSWLKQTLHRPAPKSLRELYSEQNLLEGNYMLLGLDPLYLMAYGDWRKAVTSPKLLRRERVANRETYKITVNVKPSAGAAMLFPGHRITQTVWIGVKDRLLWKSEVVVSAKQQGEHFTTRITTTFTRQEVNRNISRSAFAYKLPKGFKLVTEFEAADECGVEEGGEPEEALKGQPAIEFTLKDLQGKEVRLADYKGKVVVLNFFAHWCGPCRQEAPELEKGIWQAFREKDVVVLAVAAWARDNPTKRAQEFAKEFKLTFPVLVDEKDEVIAQYKVQGVPVTFVIDREGIIREVVLGADIQKLKRAIQSLL